MYVKNQILNMEISDLGAEGEGIGKIEGFPVFVKDTLPGDEIEVRLVKVKKNYAYGRLEKVIKPSPFRIEPVCPLARPCGGCQIMEMSYDKQLEFKAGKVRNNLIRIGGVDADYLDSIMEPIVGAYDSIDNSSQNEQNDSKAVPTRYRNKAQYPIGRDKEGNIIAGFYAGRTHAIIPCQDCKLGVEENKEVLDTVLLYMKECGITAYDEVAGTGLVRHVLIRKGFVSGQLMVCLVINGDKLPAEDVLVEKLTKIEGMTSISISINKSNSNVIMGDNYKTIWGSDTIEDTLLGLKFNISPLSFYQVNPVQVEKLYTIALDYADIKPGEEVWDICCGIGTITLCAAKRVANGESSARVHGIEIVPQAIDDAKDNAKRNGITNADFICAAAEDYMPAHAKDIKADVIILDPPRKGMDERALQVVVDTAPSRIVYVSCDSATLARDIKFLTANGYNLTKVRPVDMFGNTVHVEVATLLERVRNTKEYIQIGIDAEDYYRNKDSEKKME
ncbi:MAG TPA: 23S rRNA (uracil(1939)-C(5))-methyltransferase RlmD [Lachnospiraceae bacterium]|nr:23S rRNA (uracil(1939)-C(5))-methyltransferase RlmD [Lachnospiraceae bacterium]